MIVLVLSVAVTAVFAPIALRLYNNKSKQASVAQDPPQVGVGEDPVGVELGRAGRGTPRSAGTPARGPAAVRVCTLPQCGRPSWARMIGSRSAK